MNFSSRELFYFILSVPTHVLQHLSCWIMGSAVHVCYAQCCADVTVSLDMGVPCSSVLHGSLTPQSCSEVLNPLPVWSIRSLTMHSRILLGFAISFHVSQ